jgi:hypothetical protein
MELIIKLDDTQVKAMTRLDLADEMQEICEKAVATAIRGKFKYFAEKAEQETSKSYDWAIRSGAKFDKDKGAFVSSYMHEIRDILNNL